MLGPSTSSMDSLLQRVKDKNRKLMRKLSLSTPSSPRPLASTLQVDEHEEDTESSVLHDKVQKWIRESCPPPSPRQLPEKCSADGLERESFHSWIVRDSELRRDDVRIQNQALQIRSDVCETLYHPDFADWKTFKRLDAQKEACQLPDKGNLLDHAHDSLARFFQGSFADIVR